jgi:hypothetical protein
MRINDLLAVHYASINVHHWAALVRRVFRRDVTLVVHTPQPYRLVACGRAAHLKQRQDYLDCLRWRNL